MTAATAALSRRRARFRSTAIPTFRLAVKPTRMKSALFPAASAAAMGRPIWRMRPGVTDLRPLSATLRNSARRFNRAMSLMAPRGAPCSGAEALASLGPAARQHPAPTHRGHAGAKAMTALADEFARLIGALHGTGSD